MIRHERIIAQAILGGALWLAGGGTASAQFTLDLSGWTLESEDAEFQAFEQVPASERLEVPFSITFDGPAKVSLPLRATLVTFNAATYRIGDSFVYDVLVENTGAAPFDFPLSQQQSQFRRGMAGARAARLTLYFLDAAGHQRYIGAGEVFGATDVPGSLLRLEPGQSVVVRVRDHWWRGAIPPYFPSNWSTGSFTLRAQVMVHHVNPDYAPVVSVNTQTVQVSK